MNSRIMVGGWLLVAAGFAVIGAGWAGVQSTPVVAVQLSYIASGSITGIGLVLVGTALQRHDDARVIREIVTELRDRFDDVEHDLERLAEDVAAVRAGRQRPAGRRAS